MSADLSAETTSEDVVDGQYRSLSISAVVGLVLGLASPLCFAAALLVAVPLLGLAVSLLALRRINADSEVLTGKPLAIAGAFLAVLCLAASVTRTQVKRSLLTADAAPVADAWIERALAGDTEGAYDLTKFPSQRGLQAADEAPSRPMNGRPTGGPPPPTPAQSRRTAIADYGEDRAVRVLASLGELAEVSPLSASGVSRGRLGRVSIVWRYRVAAGSGVRGELDLLMERTAPRAGAGGQWRVANATLKPSR